MQHFRSLQACRGIAALLVVLFHVTLKMGLPKNWGVEPLLGLFTFGHAGVDFFFVLSGFIIVSAHRQDIGRPARLPDYAARRFTRIFPTYWVAFAFTLVAMLVGKPDEMPSNGWTVFKELLLLPQDTVVIGGTVVLVVPVAWTLQYEVLFYTLFGAFVRSRTLGLLAVGAVAALAGTCFSGCTFPASFVATPALPMFGLGAACAWWTRSVTTAPRTLAVLGGALYAWNAYCEWQHLPLPLGHFGYALGSAGVVLGCVAAERAAGPRPRGKRGPFELLGDASYAVYLVHQPVVSLLCKVFPKDVMPPELAFVVIACGGVAAGLAFHVFLERRLLRWVALVLRGGRPPEPRQA